MNKYVCHICGTENEGDYEYCKNCGALLQKTTDSKNSDTETQKQTPPPDYNGYTPPPAYGNKFFVLPEIDGVKAEDLAAYIGTNSNKILNKFSNMEISSSKISWCWPAAILGYILGPIGAAAWFIYRKMYKLGIILVAISVLLSCIVFAVKGDSQSSIEYLIDSFSQQLKEYNAQLTTSEFTEGNSEFEFDYPEDSKDTLRGNIAAAIENIISAATLILAGIYSLYAYKNYAVQKIKKYNIVNAADQYRQIGLMAVGGTSAGFAILTFFVNFILCTAFKEFISLFM